MDTPRPDPPYTVAFTVGGRRTERQYPTYEMAWQAAHYLRRRSRSHATIRVFQNGIRLHCFYGSKF